MAGPELLLDTPQGILPMTEVLPQAFGPDHLSVRKQTMSVDPDVLRAFPKVSLHDHLDGGLRPQTIIELAAEIDHPLPADTAEDWRAGSATRPTRARWCATWRPSITPSP